MPAILHAGLRRAAVSVDAAEKAIETAGAVELSFLERGLVTLATIANAAPGDGEWLTFDRPPKPRRMPFSDADYPAAARAAGIEDTVLVKVTVDEEGRVVDAVVLQSDSTLFDAAALRIVRRWEFLPAGRDGIPVRSTTTVPLRFTLER